MILPRGGSSFIRYSALGGVFALCWAALTGGRGWWFFLPLCLLLLLWCYWAKLSLPPVRFKAVPGFLLFFSRQLVLGAWDVAWRALAPSPRLAPQWQPYAISLAQPASQRLLASMVSLLPGTCAVNIETGQPDVLLLHVLDGNANWRSGVAALEQQLTLLLGDEPVHGQVP
ncbi:multisubunit Na+/H+ antiporter MnhE subunit [Rheinheimera pacifica]|uniref:Na+/H+ antiporter subunit E n=1 Tax=Rheinheimera pacifica TaxID=173990 RepID=UPI00285BB8AE|nr:Na+/H+ antiporter subunit E [Rheinheimera pacifica]MDR6982834.1 multisubunit Na+/H+ antiporter MnhE subunit [Rheinheimera pacifica]